MDQTFDSKILDKLQLLEKKFKNSGQSLECYLDGLLYDKYLTYWEYIQLDTLLSLQLTRTSFADEKIFITYHQITELYFNLVLHEIEQIIALKPKLNAALFLKKVKRINRYFQNLIHSFDIMIEGMDKEEFLKFRMSLLPASGFQSVQYRMIEIYTTPLNNLIDTSLNIREKYPVPNSQEVIPEIFENLYWKYGATETTTKEKTVTLKQFEQRYNPRLLRIAKEVTHSNLYCCYLDLPEMEQQNPELIEALKTMDKNINIHWSLSHLRAAYRFLKKGRKEKEEKATGGTNWKTFLPPSFQKVSFFPELWTPEEKENWGKKWVEDFIKQD